MNVMAISIAPCARTTTDEILAADQRQREIIAGTWPLTVAKKT